MDKGSGSGIFPNPDPDTDPQHWLKVHCIQFSAPNESMQRSLFVRNQAVLSNDITKQEANIPKKTRKAAILYFFLFVLYLSNFYVIDVKVLCFRQLFCDLGNYSVI